MKSLNFRRSRAISARGLWLAAAVGVMAGCSSGGPDGAANVPTTPAANTAPVILNLADLTTNQDTVVGPVSFNVGDNESNPSELTVTVRSSDTTLVPTDAVTLSGAGGVRQLTVTPAEELSGTATLTLAVRDPQGLTTEKAISVVVRTVPGSIRTTTTGAFSKGENDPATTVNGITFAQDADDPATFDALLATVPES
jgi:hypothetical protein